MAEEGRAVDGPPLEVVQAHARADVGVLDLERHLVQAGLREQEIGVPFAGLLPRGQLDPAVGKCVEHDPVRRLRLPGKLAGTMAFEDRGPEPHGLGRPFRFDERQAADQARTQLKGAGLSREQINRLLRVYGITRITRPRSSSSL